jgi:hypothetical protein
MSYIRQKIKPMKSTIFTLYFLMRNLISHIEKIYCAAPMSIFAWRNETSYREIVLRRHTTQSPLDNTGFPATA